jgi:Ribonuclease G/E
VKSRETTAYQILRDCEKEAHRAAASAGNALAIYCHPQIAELFAEDERATVEELEKKAAKPASSK